LSTRLGRKVDELCRALKELVAARSDATEWLALSEVAEHLRMDHDDLHAVTLYGVKLGRLRVEGDPPHSVAFFL
jgi:hypothetical protein